MITTFIIGCQYIVAAVAIVLACYSISRWRQNRMMYFAFLSLAGALNAIGYALEVSSAVGSDSALGAAITACKVMYLGSPFVGPLYLMFALDYTNKPFKRRWQLALIFAPAVLFSLAVFTYPSTRLYYAELGYSTTGWQPHLAVSPGPLYYPCFAFEFALAIAGAVILIHSFMHEKARRHTVIFLLSATLPMTAQIVNFTKAFPGQVNTVPTALTVTIGFLSWYLARYRRAEWQSLGRELVVQNMNNAFILIDTAYQILDSNIKARHYFPALTNARVGTPLRVIPNFPVGLLTDSNEFDFELHADGDDLFLHLVSTALKSSGALIGSCLMIYDNTEAHLMMGELSRLARHDDLTGLNNRAAFFNDAKALYDLSLRQSIYPGSALMIDIDHFKAVNDTYGHAAGDDVLRAIGNLMRRRMRHTDICGRYGGEELCIWCPYTDSENALIVAEDMRKSVEAMEFTTDRGSFKVTISIGIASSGEDGPEDFDDIIKRADDALYLSKSEGRNIVSVFTD